MANAVNLYSGRAVDAIRVLLVRYPREWTLRELAKEAGISLSRLSEIANALIRERMALRASDRSELKIMTPSDLLKRWATVNNFTANTRFLEYYSEEQDIGKLMEKFKGKQKPEYAFTTLAGALLVAPYVRPTNVHIYVKNEEDAKKWADEIGLRPIESGGDVKFAIAENLGIFYGSKEIDGVRVVSDIQLYVDLLNYPARGEEAAQALLKVIEKRWRGQK